MVFPRFLWNLLLNPNSAPNFTHIRFFLGLWRQFWIFGGTVAQKVRKHQTPHAKLQKNIKFPEKRYSWVKIGAEFKFFIENFQKTELHSFSDKISKTLVKFFFFRISTRIDDSVSHHMVAVIYPTRIYVTRQHLVSGCVTVLSTPGYVEYRLSGKFGGGAWTGDDLMIWYQDMGGAYVATFQFKFPSDYNCDPQKIDWFFFGIFFCWKFWNLKIFTGFLMNKLINKVMN